MTFRDLDEQEEDSDEDVLAEGDYGREEEEEENASTGEGEGNIDGVTSGCVGAEDDGTVTCMGADTRGNGDAGKGTGSARDFNTAGNRGEGDAMDQVGQDQPAGQADGRMRVANRGSEVCMVRTWTQLALNHLPQLILTQVLTAVRSQRQVILRKSGLPIFSNTI